MAQWYLSLIIDLGKKRAWPVNLNQTPENILGNASILSTGIPGAPDTHVDRTLVDEHIIRGRRFRVRGIT